MKIQFIDLKKQYHLHQSAIDAAIHQVLEDGQYIMGLAVQQFEQAASTYLGCKHTLSCANGTDALVLSLKAMHLQANDVVFVPSLTFAATAESVVLCGGIPFFVDVDPYTYNLDLESLKSSIIQAKQLGLKCTGIIPVDLFGQAADYSGIEDIAQENKLWVLSDGAQAFGATHKKVPVCACKHCDIAATSFFPAKPLGCYGDGGAVFTNDGEVYALLKSLRVHGQGIEKYENIRIGYNSRLDTLQAAILIEKLKLFPEEVRARNRIANAYNEGLKAYVQVPLVSNEETYVWAQYTICLKEGQNRKQIMEHLKAAGIPSNVYYPKPLHLQKAYKDFYKASDMHVSEFLAQNVLSLPMSPYLEDSEIDYIVEHVVAELK